MTMHRCRPCQKDFAEVALLNLRRCPLCQGPLLTHAQLHEHARTAQEALDRLRKQSAVTMAGALLAWHQYRSYTQVLRLERSKGKGSQVPA